MKVSKNWQLKILFFIGFVPAMVAWFMAATGVGVPEGMKNHGELMAPGMVVPQEVRGLQSDLWALMMVGEECAENCKEQLILLQQIHKALGKEFSRVQSIWLKKNDVELFPAKKLALQSEQVTEKMTSWLIENNLPVDDYSIWLIDPLGNLVLRFSPGTDGKDILKDIRWLLKVSKIG
ncbi:MAG: hypothetical protein COA99_03250 [Moraxellaceae bacterium]|nr:MAG: hypothetical protein COA99_03250 [Moraxellaceae bacterium]